MSNSRTIARNAKRRRKERAIQLGRECPVCGAYMRPVWYSVSKRKCPQCKTSVCVPWMKWR